MNDHHFPHSFARFLSLGSTNYTKRDHGKTKSLILLLLLLLLLSLSGERFLGKREGEAAAGGRTKGWLSAVGWDKRPHTQPYDTYIPVADMGKMGWHGEATGADSCLSLGSDWMIVSPDLG